MMAGLRDSPLLFLDVDGPLIPFHARPPGRHTLALGEVVGSADAPGNPLIDRLDPADGRRLLALGCQMGATTWMAHANEIIAPRLGLPELPVVEFPDEDED